jgi:hypothetical protein
MLGISQNVAEIIATTANVNTFWNKIGSNSTSYQLRGDTS